jgi:hypothetical protein
MIQEIKRKEKIMFFRDERNYGALGAIKCS